MTRAKGVARRLRNDLANRIRSAPPDLRDLPPLAAWDRLLHRVVPIVFAISTGLQITKYIAVPQGIGFDAGLYTAAAREWLSGGNPWSVTSYGIPFGAPPPTLLAYVPFTLLPDWLTASIWIVGSFVLAFLAIRALGLKLWWISFWPIVDGALVGNPDVAVLALLVISRQRFSGLAPLLKIYAIFPLISQGRWKAIAAGIAIVAATAPFLPWALWVANLPSIARAVELNAHTTSVAGNVPLMMVGTIALVALGYRRAGWLVVPVLWPWTQPHYLAMSVPALTPTLAIIWSIPGPPPLVTLAGVTLTAIGFRLFPHLQPPSDATEPASAASISTPGPVRE